jgi:chemotaxis protein methyltransferase CheR
MYKLAKDEFDIVVKTVYEATGIQLDASKVYLVETRLGPLLKEFGLATYRELITLARTKPESNAMAKVIDAITTNETFFFRDTQPFELLRQKLLPDLYDRRELRRKSGIPSGPLRIWSAACSTGQEVYSIAIILKELLPLLGNPQVKLLGTDISRAVIAQASAGRYNRFEVERGLPPEKREKYFVPDPQTGGWRIRDELRAMATFQPINLMESFRGIGTWDIIFCRNVAIYFAMEDRKKLFDRIADALTPGGMLVIGASEFLMGISERFEAQHHMRSVYYTLKEGGGAGKPR